MNKLTIIENPQNMDEKPLLYFKGTPELTEKFSQLFRSEAGIYGRVVTTQKYGKDTVHFSVCAHWRPHHTDFWLSMPKALERTPSGDPLLMGYAPGAAGKERFIRGSRDEGILVMGTDLYQPVRNAAKISLIKSQTDIILEGTKQQALGLLLQAGLLDLSDARKAGYKVSKQTISPN